MPPFYKGTSKNNIVGRCRIISSNLTTIRRISFCPGHPPPSSFRRCRRRGDFALNSSPNLSSPSADRSLSSSDSRIGDILRDCLDAVMSYLPLTESITSVIVTYDWVLRLLHTCDIGSTRRIIRTLSQRSSAPVNNALLIFIRCSENQRERTLERSQKVSRKTAAAPSRKTIGALAVFNGAGLK